MYCILVKLLTWHGRPRLSDLAFFTNHYYSRCIIHGHNMFSLCCRLSCRKINELEEELKVVGNNMKALEIAEQEVDKQTALRCTHCNFHIALHLSQKYSVNKPHKQLQYVDQNMHRPNITQYLSGYCLLRLMICSLPLFVLLDCFTTVNESWYMMQPLYLHC